MKAWTTILGIVLVLYAGFVVYRGRLTNSDDYGNSSVVDRSKNPVQFWLSVAGMLVIAVILIFNVFHF